MTDNSDLELIRAFYVESGEILEKLEVDLQRMEFTPGDTEVINAVFRGLHTIKGNSSFLSLDNVTKLAHVAETMLDKARKKELTVSGAMMELVREEDMINPPPGLPLLQIVDREGVTESKRKIFRLSELGTAEELAWGDLRKAWQEKWPMPRKMEVPPEVEAPPEAVPGVPPEVPPAAVPKVVTKPIKPPKKPAGFPTVTFAEKPSNRQFKSMLKHLQALKSIGVDDPRVWEELAKKVEWIPGTWQVSLEDMIEAEERKEESEMLEVYEGWIDQMMPLYEALADRDIDTAIGILEMLI